MNSDKVLVTGATGFVGRALVDALARQHGVRVRALLRRADSRFAEGVEPSLCADLAGAVDFRPLVAGCTSVIHTAARVHVMQTGPADAPDAFHRLNVAVTERLASAAAVAGVRRFVFLSTIKVNGEQTARTAAFTAHDVPNPQDPYAVSKWQAELALRRIAAATGMQVVIIRPPLVYGPGVRANFAALMRGVARGLPLPLGAIDNRRSLIALDNLVDFILTCLAHPAAANETFVVSDGEDLSTPELVRRMARAMGRPARLLPVPESFLLASAALFARRAAAERLCGSLRIDGAKARALLGWRAPVKVDEGLRRAVAGLQAKG